MLKHSDLILLGLPVPAILGWATVALATSLINRRSLIEIIGQRCASLPGMVIEGLEIPAQLMSLVEARIWPRTSSDARAAVAQPRVAKDRVALISPDDRRIELRASENLMTLSKEIEHYRDYYQREGIGPELDFWTTRGDLENINPQLAICIGDFGLGSDSPIVLDYRRSKSAPLVLRLKWEQVGIERSHSGDVYAQRTQWVVCARTFDEFVELCCLTSAAPLRPLGS